MDLASLDITSYYIVPFAQLAAAMALGGLLGIERSIAGKTAGMRTYALVSLGACLFILMTSAVVPNLPGQFDALRIPAGVITGIGFIGAGLIIFKEEQSTISGLTTAAGLWVAAGIGLSVGYGLYGLAVFATLLTLFVFSIMWDMEQKLVTTAKKNDIYTDEEKEEKEFYDA